jgi:UDP-N-acetyl-2-amino-2-deoxyglucuronate dehydrogenase
MAPASTRGLWQVAPPRQGRGMDLRVGKALDSRRLAGQAMSTDLGIAIVGAGIVARYHSAAIAATPGARLVAVSRSDAARAADAAAEFGVPCETSLDALLAREDVDAVCVCTPSGQHAAQAVAAARAGKHVLVEKPMALTLADADAMIGAAREAGVHLAVAFQRRTEPVYQAVRAAVAAGDLGHLMLGAASVPYFRSQDYYRSAVWRGTWAMDGGGALMNQGIHLADLLLWFMGEVVEVNARADTLAHAIEVEDNLACTLAFASGALGTIYATTAAAPGFPHRIELYGSEGGVQVEGEAVVRWHARTPAPEAPAGSGAAAAGSGGSPTAIGTTGHTRLLADFVAAVREGRPPLVTGEEGRRSLALVLAVYESARSGQAVRLLSPS